MIHRCQGAAEHTVRLKPGVYDICLEHPCNLYGPDWVLLPTIQRNINMSLVNAVIDINVTFMNLFTLKLNHMPWAMNLNAMDAVEQRQVTIQDLYTPDVPIPVSHA